MILSAATKSTSRSTRGCIDDEVYASWPDTAKTRMPYSVDLTRAKHHYCGIGRTPSVFAKPTVWSSSRNKAFEADLYSSLSLCCERTVRFSIHAAANVSVPVWKYVIATAMALATERKAVLIAHTNSTYVQSCAVSCDQRTALSTRKFHILE